MNINIIISSILKKLRSLNDVLAYCNVAAILRFEIIALWEAKVFGFTRDLIFDCWLLIEPFEVHFFSFNPINFSQYGSWSCFDVDMAKDLLAILGVEAMLSMMAATLSQHGGRRLSGNSVVVCDVMVSWTGIEVDFVRPNFVWFRLRVI